MGTRIRARARDPGGSWPSGREREREHPSTTSASAGIRVPGCVEAGDCQPSGLLPGTEPRLPSSPCFLHLDFLEMDGERPPRARVPGRTQNGTHAAPPTQVSPGCLGLRPPGERRKDAWCDLSVWSPPPGWSARSPAGRTGARGHRGAQAPAEARQEERRGAGSWPSRQLGDEQRACSPSIHPSPHARSLRGPPIGRSAELALVALRGGACRRPAGLRHQPAPEAAALHVGPVASWREPRRPRRRSAITGSARTPTPWRTTRCASERAGRGPGGSPSAGGPRGGWSGGHVR